MNKENLLAVSLIIGAGFGVGIGMVMGNMAIWTGIGAGIGFITAKVMEKNKEKEDSE